jgi:hypothetical protein
VHRLSATIWQILVRDWPPITEPSLLARLALSADEFAAYARRLVGSFEPRELTDEVYARALSYPWARPAQSFVLDQGHVELLTELPRDLSAGASRYPLLAFGANGSPDRLATRFDALEPDQRRLVALAGELHDFDVGAACAPANYGAFPATIFPSPGTAVRASVLWVTTAQLTALAAMEFTYFFGRLDGIRFVPEFTDAPPLTRIYAFVSRWGAYSINDRIVALDAVPARGRLARSCTQEELLDDLARDAFGQTASAAAIVARIMEDFPATAEQIRPLLTSRARPFVSDHWVPFPTTS